MVYTTLTEISNHPAGTSCLLRRGDNGEPFLEFADGSTHRFSTWDTLSQYAKPESIVLEATIAECTDKAVDAITVPVPSSLLRECVTEAVELLKKLIRRFTP